MTRRQPSDPAEYRPRRHSRPPSIARYPGQCEACSLDINPGDHIIRMRGREMHIACAGRE
jgi:hypothetical protein